MTESKEPLYSNRPYMVAFTATIILFLLTLTAVIILIIIGRARETDREDEFNTTLTAVWGQANQTQAPLFASPTGAPAVTLGEYPFALAPDSPVYRAAENCELQVVTGHILAEDDAPTDAFAVSVWGDYTPLQTIATGELAGLDAGEWRLQLEGFVERRLWIQLSSDTRYFSPPVEIVLDGADCERNEIELTFQQVAPLN